MLTAIDESGKPVDWWFLYKLPSGVKPRAGQHSGKKTTQGNEYLYYDPRRKRPLELSPYRLGAMAQGAFFCTLEQIFDKPASQVGWIFYNDEYPADISPFQETDQAGGATKEELAARIATIEKTLVASWQAGESDWPPTVKPRLKSAGSPRGQRGRAANHDTCGHTKGILAFDLASDSAFWLSHSTPRIPALKTPANERFFYPPYADQYAQTFVCISLDVAAASDIANVMKTQHEPQVFGCHLPAGVGDVPEPVAAKGQASVTSWQAENPSWQLYNLAQGSVPPSHGEAYRRKHERRPPAKLSFSSRGVAGVDKKQFLLLAKSAAWADDFWIDLVGPSLPNGKTGRPGVDLRVETWRRLTPSAMLPKDNVTDDDKDPVFYGSHDFSTPYKGRQYHHEFLERNGHEIVDEVTNIDLRDITDPAGLLTGVAGAKLGGYVWSYTRDHAKWAISEQDDERGVKTLQLVNGVTLADEPGQVSDWVCVADLNRMTSQERRGGGAICFHEPLLWHGLNQIERISGKIT